MEKLVSAYLDGDIPKQTYLKKKDEILLASAVLEQKKKDFENGRKKWVEPLREWILDTKQADFLSKSDNFHEIKTFVQKIGTNPRVRNKSAVFDFCPPSQFAAKRRTILRSAAASRPRGATLSNREVSIGGKGEIRTLDTLSGMPLFESGTFNHSVTFPFFRKITPLQAVSGRTFFFPSPICCTMEEEFLQEIKLVPSISYDEC